MTSCFLFSKFFCDKTNEKLTTVHSSDPRVSGPILWDAFFHIAVGYPNNPSDETQENAIKFLESIHAMSPSKESRCFVSNYNKNIDLQKVCSSKQKFLTYWVDLKNAVSEKLNKNIIDVKYKKPMETVEGIIEKYSQGQIDDGKPIHDQC